MDISVSEAHNRLSQLLKEAQERPVVITRHGEPVGVLISHEEYERLSEVKAYLQIVKLSQQLDDRGVTAKELVRSSRDELEARG
jgi:prevent-host-death family protein